MGDTPRIPPIRYLAPAFLFDGLQLTLLCFRGISCFYLLYGWDGLAVNHRPWRDLLRARGRLCGEGRLAAGLRLWMPDLLLMLILPYARFVIPLNPLLGLRVMRPFCFYADGKTI
jgi:hypothetical protein